MIEGIVNDLKQYYGNRRAMFSSESQFVGWKDDHAQRVRFDQLYKIMERDSGFSVNDLGCGLAHFIDYLCSMQQEFQYAGYDMLDEMVDGAVQKHANKANASFTRIVHANEMATADYTIASGIFNLRYGISLDVWTKYILDTLTVMNDKSNKAFAFNALTKYSDAELMRNELHYSDPLFLFDYCKRNFAKDVALLHDYHQYDFTILVRKL
jgi:SAM-dependent methyltransferase